MTGDEIIIEILEQIDAVLFEDPVTRKLRVVCAPLEKARADVAEMRGVVDAAIAWREGRDRSIIGTAPPGGQRSASGVALIDAIDALIEARHGG